MKFTKINLLRLAIILSVVLVQMASAAHALADDGAPPEETPVVTPTEDPAGTPDPSATPEAAPTEEIAPTEEVAPTEEIAPTEEGSPTEPASEPTEELTPEETVTPAPEESATPDPEETPASDPEETPAADLDCVPAADPESGGDAAPAQAGTVPEENGGESLPPCPGTIEENLTVSYSDPMWCPANSVPGDAACTDSFATITELINYLRDHPGDYYGDGAIYFQTGDYTGPETYISISYSTVPALGTLDVYGGWDLDPDGGYAGNTGETVFTVPLEVVWDSDVTLADITVNLPSGSTNAGVFVNTSGSITVNNVHVTGGYSGAELVNTGGGGNVNVYGSGFSGNTNTGLLILSNGSVSLTDVVASDNNNGIFINNTTGLSEVHMTNVFADNNGWTGVDVRSSGHIDMNGGHADGNTVGANLQTTSGSGNIFVSGTVFTGNSSIGIRAVTSEGNIELNNVVIDNQNASGSFGAWLKSTAGGTITVNGGTFANADTGLFVVGTGDVNLTNVTASGNAGNGAVVESGWVFGCFGPRGIAVSVTGGTYADNGGYGFAIYPGPEATAPTLAGSVFNNNTEGDYLVDLARTCNPGVDKPSKPYQVVELSGQGDDPTQLDCVLYSGVILILPDQSRVKLHCPVDGEVTVAEAALDKLPGDPPKSVEFVDGLVVTSGDSSLLPEGGSMKMCFKIPPDMEGKNFAILYWDPIANSGAGGWVELPVNQFGGQVFPLHPDTPEDGMLIFEGVYPCGDSICVKVNFTGTFILVAR